MDTLPMMSKTCFRYVVHAWGAQLSAWIATALAFHCHKAAEAMADDEGALTQLSSGNYGADFLGAKLRGVVRTPVAVAHSGQINRRDAKVAGEVRRNVTPPVA